MRHTPGARAASRSAGAIESQWKKGTRPKTTLAASARKRVRSATRSPAATINVTPPSSAPTKMRYPSRSVGTQRMPQTRPETKDPMIAPTIPNESSCQISSKLRREVKCGPARCASADIPRQHVAQKRKRPTDSRSGSSGAGVGSDGSATRRRPNHTQPSACVHTLRLSSWNVSSDDTLRLTGGEMIRRRVRSRDGIVVGLVESLYQLQSTRLPAALRAERGDALQAEVLV